VKHLTCHHNKHYTMKKIHQKGDSNHYKHANGDSHENKLEEGMYLKGAMERSLTQNIESLDIESGQT
jgi:hypothetical protein